MVITNLQAQDNWLTNIQDIGQLVWSLHFQLRHNTWIPWNLSFRYILFHEKRLQTMLWHHNARVNSHQRGKQTRFRVCFHLWCELTSTMNVTEWQVSWNSWYENRCSALHVYKHPSFFWPILEQLNIYSTSVVELLLTFCSSPIKQPN